MYSFFVRLIFHGARGSHPVSGPHHHRYGGHTPCISLETSAGIIVLDAGTGLISLSEELIKRPSIPPIAILFTHIHLDHLAGITAFKPLLMAGTHITLMAETNAQENWITALKTIGDQPYWPVSLWNAGASVQFQSLPTKTSHLDLFGLHLSWCPIRHPQGGVSYKLSSMEQTLVLATDREPGDPKLDAVFLEFCRGADLLIHDAQFTPEEFPQRIGWGHSTWEMAAQVAAEAKVKKLILTSHDPSRTDAEIDLIAEKTRKIFPHSSAASENLTLELGKTSTWTTR